MLNSLPLSVLEKILHQTAELNVTYQFTLDEWKSKLPLLAVCQKWSSILLSQIYYYGIIHCRDITTYNSSDTNALGRPNDSVPTCLWTSNIPCIKMRNLSCGIRYILISVRSKQDTLSLYKTIIDMLGFGDADWSQVRELNIRHSYIPIVDSDGEEYSSSEAERRLSAIIYPLREYMPNVTHLYFGLRSPQGSTKVLVEAVFNIYAMQLEKLCCEDPIRFINTQLPTTLTHLQLALDKNAKEFLPFVCAGPLRRLYLTNVPPTFTWKYFSKGYGDREIIFNQLEYLVLYFLPSPKESTYDEIYYSDSVPASYYYRLVMPKLRHISMSNCPQNNDIFFADLCAPNLSTFNIAGPFCTVRQIANAKFYSDHFQLYLHSIDKKDQQGFYKVTNSLFSNQHKMSSGTLIVECHGFNIDCSLINWTILRTIEIRSVIDYKQMLAIILHLPKLNFLHVRRLAFSNNEIDMLNRDIQLLAAQPVEPLISDITILNIGTATNNYPADMVMAKVMYLVLGLINLRELHVDEDLQLHAIQFIDFCHNAYPHLSNILVE